MTNAYLRIRIAYYSGTGGTELVAKRFQSNLETKGCICTIEQITNRLNRENFDKFDKKDCNLLLLLFPVHAFNAPEAVYQWIEDLESVKGTDAAVISVSGGGDVCPNTACRVSSIKRLAQRGYDPIYENMIVMPSNWMVAAPAPLPYLLLQALPVAVDNITKDLLSGKHRRTKPLWVDRMFSVMGEWEKPAGRFWGKRIKVLKHCTGCGWCAKQCPSGNIILRNGIPEFNGTCHFCLKCIYGCPSKALQPGIYKCVMIEEGYCLQDIEKSLSQELKVDVKALKVGFFWLGVKKYLLSLRD